MPDLRRGNSFIASRREAEEDAQIAHQLRGGQIASKEDALATLRIDEVGGAGAEILQGRRSGSRRRIDVEGVSDPRELLAAAGQVMPAVEHAPLLREALHGSRRVTFRVRAHREDANLTC